VNGFLRLEGVTRRYGEKRAVDDVTLEVGQGEFFSLLGPSGCGKTTLLRMVAGFERPDAGRIWLEGEDITDLPPERRKVNTIFQSYALFPHLTVWENIAFGPQVARRPRREIADEVERMLDLIQMAEHRDKKPAQLSGGMKQRVAVARALINRPRLLLLDEPLAALDLKLRQRMLLELDLIHDQVGITFLYVTHDQHESMSLSDRIAVMREGRIEQLGTPVEIYEAPRNSFVAAFIGDTNFFRGSVSGAPDAGEAAGEYSRLAIQGFPEILCFNDKKLVPGEPVWVSLRPEKLRISRERPAGGALENVVPGNVEDVVYLGSYTKFWVRVSDHRLAVHQQHGRFLLDERPIRWGEPVWLSWHADDGFMLERYSEADVGLLGNPPEGAPPAGGADR
jgi:spermidine/putrescine transport system ATP-binding protein